MIERRLENRGKEMSPGVENDELLINDGAHMTPVDDLLAILRAERRKRPRLAKHIESFVAKLLSEP